MLDPEVLTGSADAGRPLAILGSARSEGNTAALLHRLIAGLDCQVVDLLKEPVLPFSYGLDPRPDSFPRLLELAAAAPLLVIATPVYWYSYSAQLKCLLDRFYDLPRAFPEMLGRFRGKQIVLLASGETAELESALTLAFSQFCDALGMNCIALVYGQGAGPFADLSAVNLVRERMAGLAKEAPGRNTAG